MTIIEVMGEFANQYVGTSSMNNSERYYYPPSSDDLSTSSYEYSDCGRFNQNIPQNPLEWTNDDVRNWLKWISIDDLELEKVNISGKQLIQMEKTAFCSFFPDHVGEFLWQHIVTLIRHVCPKKQLGDQTEMLELFDYEVPSNQCRSNTTSPQNYNSYWTNHQLPYNQTFNNISNSCQHIQHNNNGYFNYHPIHQQHLPSCMYETQISPMHNQSYNNSTIGDFNQPQFVHTNPSQTSKTIVSRSLGQGPIQLWEFLLELLLDPRLSDVIAWTGNGWEFKLINPEVVAELWGRKKCKPKMNYEKLSRGLRYYYDKRIILKTAGKRYVYKFVCDMRQLVNCDSPQELYATRLQTNYKKAFYNLS